MAHELIQTFENAAGTIHKMGRAYVISVHSSQSKLTHDDAEIWTVAYCDPMAGHTFSWFCIPL